jgi:transcriptional regulator with XRE-family HTH domain
MAHRIGTDVTPLLHRAMHLLGLSQRALGELCGASLRTGHRWANGRAYPSVHQLQTLARALHPSDPGLAAEMAAEAGTTLVKWGIAPPEPEVPKGPPPRPFPSIPLMVDAIVLAAVDAADPDATAPVSRHAIRAALRAGFSRARALGLSLQEVDDALGPAAAKGTTKR